jgi:N-succinyldiaminopimelate aminotransferase
MNAVEHSPGRAALRTFFMEEHLESARFTARFNLGESGSWPTTVRELLAGTESGGDDAVDELLGLTLRDSPNWGSGELREHVASLHPGSSPDEVLITTGTSEALFLLFHRLRPARTALAMPAFQLLHEVPRSLGSSIVELPIHWDSLGRPFVDEPEWLDLLLRERPDCLVLNQPHNPSGLMLRPAFVAQLVDLALALKATLIGDEHYRFLASDDGPLGPTIHRPSSRVFITGSYIKCLGCPGLRIGWCVGDHAMLAAMQSDKNYTTHTVNPVSEWLSCRVLRDLSAPIWRAHRDSWKANRRALAALLTGSRRLVGVPPQGGLVTAIGWNSVRSRAELDATFEAMRAASLFVLPLEAMELAALARRSPGPLGQGFGFRLGLGARPDHFASALEELARVVPPGEL